MAGRLEQVFVCADVFLRFLVRDDEECYGRARQLFERAENGGVKLKTTALAVAELVSELERNYTLGRGEISDVVEAIMGTRNLTVADGQLVSAAAEYYGAGEVSFADAYNLAYVRSMRERRMATFDRRRTGGAADVEHYWGGAQR